VHSHAKGLARRTHCTEDWRVAFVLVICVPLTVAAWVKVGPIAGVAAIAWLVFMLFIASRPGTTLWGPGPWSPPSRSSSSERPPDTHADREKNRRA
jgi:hypothetical protein